MARGSRPQPPSFRASRQPLLSTLSSITGHLRTDQNWKDRLQFNEFHARPEILNGHDVLEPIDDMHVIQAQERLQQEGFTKATKETVRDALTLVGSELAYHPIRDWLVGLKGKWDQIGRADHWLVDCFGCEDTLYTRCIGRMFIIAMVARIMRPGCQADYMLVLEGSQGIQKSRACRVLAGEDAFDDNLRLDDPVRTSMALRGKWLLEVSEMDAFKGKSMDMLKAFVTRRVEHYTPKYSRSVVAEPRQCLFIGTQNGRFSYQDLSGARRFWPVEVGEIDPDRLAGMREQLFAEALALFEAGEQWWPDAGMEEQHIRPVQEDRREAEAWVEKIDQWLHGTGSPAQPIMLMQVWTDCLGGSMDRYNQEISRRIANALRLLGWEDKHTNKARLWSEKPIPGLGR